jgi:hypothetical protein
MRRDAVFRRTKTGPDPTATTETREGGKGRPTPTRKEAEAAAKARAQVPRTRKDAARAARESRATRSAQVREAMKTGDERYLPPRDKGPQRRFLRDLVDSRLCMAELLLPLLVAIMVTTAISQRLASGLWSGTIVLVGLDSALLVFRVRRELRKRFPGESTRGAIIYALMRSIQLRWLRMPRRMVKLGATLPDRY